VNIDPVVWQFTRQSSTPRLHKVHKFTRVPKKRCTQRQNAGEHWELPETQRSYVHSGGVDEHKVHIGGEWHALRMVTPA
jgi:hypothetical protein